MAEPCRVRFVAWPDVNVATGQSGAGFDAYVAESTWRCRDGRRHCSKDKGVMLISTPQSTQHVFCLPYTGYITPCARCALVYIGAVFGHYPPCLFARFRLAGDLDAEVMLFVFSATNLF